MHNLDRDNANGPAPPLTSHSGRKAFLSARAVPFACAPFCSILASFHSSPRGFLPSASPFPLMADANEKKKPKAVISFWETHQDGGMALGDKKVIETQQAQCTYP